MGYESKLYVVEKTKRTFTNGRGKIIVDNGMMIDGKPMYYAMFIAAFDLCKCYPVLDRMRKYPETDNYIFADDGNTKIIYDCYEERLKEIPLHDAIIILESEMLKEEYRRYAPCVAALKALEANSDKWNEIVVLHYGH